MSYCGSTSSRILNWFRQIPFPRLRKHRYSIRAIHGVENSEQQTVLISDSMADRPSQLRGRAATEDQVRDLLSFSSMTAETSRRPVLNRSNAEDGISTGPATGPAGSSTVRTATHRALASIDIGIGYNHTENHSDTDEDSLRYTESPIATSKGVQYLSELKYVAIDDLQTDCRTCGICQETYDTGDDPEQPYLVGSCGHILGGQCLAKWVLPDTGRQNRSCPMCRAVLFEDDTRGGPDAYDADEDFLLDMLDEDDDMEDYSNLDAGELLAPAHSADRVVEYYDRLIDYRRSMTSGTETRRAQRPRQRAFLFAEDILISFRQFVQRTNRGTPESLEMGQSLRSQMGRLYVRLREDMAETQMPIVWNENGPPLSFLLDPAAIPLIENALESLMAIEGLGYESDDDE